MDLPDKCQKCTKPKVFHHTQVFGTTSKKLDLCAECPLAKKLENPGGFGNMDDDFPAESGSSVNKSGGDSDSPACPVCGYTTENFKKNGRVGCPSCYEFFKDAIQPLLPDMHRGCKHTGKVPVTMFTIEDLRLQLADYSVKLTDAINQEKYEDAARFRDQIAELKTKLETTSH